MAPGLSAQPMVESKRPGVPPPDPPLVSQRPVKRDLPIPPKPNIKAEIQSSRRQIIEMNKRPSGFDDPERLVRRSWSPDDQYSIPREAPSDRVNESFHVMKSILME